MTSLGAVNLCLVRSRAGRFSILASSVAFFVLAVRPAAAAPPPPTEDDIAVRTTLEAALRAAPAPLWPSGMDGYWIAGLMGRLVTLARSDWNGRAFDVAYIMIKPILELQCRARRNPQVDFCTAFKVVPAGAIDYVECSAITVSSHGYSRELFYNHQVGWWIQVSTAWLDPWSWNVAFFRVDASVAPPAQ